MAQSCFEGSEFTRSIATGGRCSFHAHCARAAIRRADMMPAENVISCETLQGRYWWFENWFARACLCECLHFEKAESAQVSGCVQQRAKGHRSHWRASASTDCHVANLRHMRYMSCKLLSDKCYILYRRFPSSETAAQSRMARERIPAAIILPAATADFSRSCARWRPTRLHDHITPQS